MAITRYLSVGEETTFGTAATTMNATIDVESAELDPNGDSALIYEGASGIDNLAAPGNYTSGGSIAFPADDKNLGYFLKWGLGGYSVTGASGTFTHVFTPTTQRLMKSFTAKVGKDAMEHIFTGAVVDQIGLSLEGGFLGASVDILAGQDSNGGLTTPTFTQGNIFAPHQVSMNIGGALSDKVESFNLSMAFNADNESGINIGSRFPKRAFRGATEVELEVTLSFFDNAELVRFWGASGGPSNSLTYFSVIINVGDNLDITLPRCIYTNMSQPLSGRDRITQTGTIRALASVDGLTGPINISLTNNVTTY